MTKKIYIIAGEASGDTLGAQLMNALQQQSQEKIQFFGVGGQGMGKQGMNSLFPMKDLSVMGLTEILPSLPKILRRIKQTTEHIREIKPDIIVTIDSPDFCKRVVAKLRNAQQALPKIVHYVAPTVWAWRPERAKTFAKLYDGIMCLYPMEPRYFEDCGMKACFVGHPALQKFKADKSKASDLREQLGINDDCIVLGTFFGSRQGEVNRVGPVIRDAVFQYARHHKNIFVIAPTLPHIEKQVRNLLESMPCAGKTITDNEQKFPAMRCMDYAVATSGTIGLELSVADVPHVIAYKVNALTAQIVKRKLITKYAHLTNILLDKEAVPEFIQHNCTSENLLTALEKLPELKEAQKAAFNEMRKLITGEDTKLLPEEQAARFVLSFFENDVIQKAA